MAVQLVKKKLFLATHSLCGRCANAVPQLCAFMQQQDPEVALNFMGAEALKIKSIDSERKIYKVISCLLYKTGDLPGIAEVPYRLSKSTDQGHMTSAIPLATAGWPELIACGKKKKEDEDMEDTQEYIVDEATNDSQVEETPVVLEGQPKIMKTGPVPARLTIAQAIELHYDLKEDKESLDSILMAFEKSNISTRVKSMLIWHRDEYQRSLDKVYQVFTNTHVVI